MHAVPVARWGLPRIQLYTGSEGTDMLTTVKVIGVCMLWDPAGATEFEHSFDWRELQLQPQDAQQQQQQQPATRLAAAAWHQANGSGARASFQLRSAGTRSI